MYAHLFDDKGEKIPNTIIILDDEEGGDMLLVGRDVIAAYFPEFGGLFLFSGLWEHIEYMKQFLSVIGLDDEGDLEKIKTDEEWSAYLLNHHMAEYVDGECVYGRMFE